MSGDTLQPEPKFHLGDLVRNRYSTDGETLGHVSYSAFVAGEWKHYVMTPRLGGYIGWPEQLLENVPKRRRRRAA